jgi:hypothetical protein
MIPFRFAAILTGVFLALGQAVSQEACAAEFPKFETRVIDPEVGKICYAVTLADVDGDGKQDIVAVTENRVVWFQNPDWKLRVIIADQTERDNVCIAPHDIDGDGQVDFALGAGWTKIGTLQWLSRGKSLEEKWHVHFIGQEGWLHRMRWGDLLGTGRPQLVISPLNKTVAKGVRLTAFEIPANPKTDPWKATVLDSTLNAMHNHWMGDFDGDGKTDAITASQEGVFLFQQPVAGEIVKTQLASGAADPVKPTGRGAGEVKVGKLAGNRRFIATIEPMHGNQVVVYTEPPANSGEKLWVRHLLDDTLGRGHAVGVADVDRDGSDELIIGHSDPAKGPITGPGVYIYNARDAAGTQWEKHVIDNGGIATEDLVVTDLDGDGWVDIVAGGRATHNVKLYVNQGRK